MSVIEYFCPDGTTSVHQSYFVHSLGIFHPLHHVHFGITPAPHVALYRLEGKKFAIDTSDWGHISCQKSLDWADVYFKTNMWRSLSYPRKVLPMMNPMSIDGLIETNRMQSFRNQPKEIDISFTTRMFGSKAEKTFYLLDALAAIDCKKDIYVGVLPDACTKKNIEELAARGIAAHRSPVGRMHVIDQMSRSKLSLMRMGLKDAMPWRATEALACGASIVFDMEPVTQWHVPLERGKHFASLDWPVQDITSAKNIIEEALQNYEAISAHATEYFDNHCSPKRLARYVLDIVHSI